MLRIAKAGKAESFCVDGDIKRIAGSLSESTVAYLKAHIADSQYTTTHLESLAKDQRDEITAILQEWLKTSEDSRSSRKKLGVKATPDQIWNFIFGLQPEAVTTCFGRIEPLLKEKRYQQVVDSCSAILHHYPSETAPILLQRALAYTMLGGREKEAIADYIRAFIKDKDATIQVTRSKHGQYLPHITELLRNCVFSTQPPGSLDSKVVKQWHLLTIDCCRLLLTLDPNNFKLQMTFASRLKSALKTDKAVAVLNEAVGVLKLDLEPDPFKLSEAWLRRGECALAKQQTEQAVTDIMQGLNAVSDAALSASGKQDNDDNVTRTFLEQSDDIEKTQSLAKEIFADASGSLLEIQSLLEKAAAKLNPASKYSGVVKMETVRQAIELYRAILVVKPKDRETLIKLSGCYSKLGRHKCSVNIYDYLLRDKNFAQDSILTARAACYRELGNKAEARKDYDALLRGNPQDAALLFERSIVHMENNDILSLVTDLQAAFKSNQRTVASCLNKLSLALRTRIRQILFDHAKALLQDAPMPEIGRKNIQQIDEASAGSVALEIAQLLTKINPADNAAHIIKAHALFFIGSFNDAETCLKRLLQETPQNPDTHIMKLHLGLLRIFTRHIDEGMTLLVEVLTNKGERAVLTLLRDIPSAERDRLSDECHHYAIDLLLKRRDSGVVRQAAHSFTIAILCCRGPDIAIEGLNTSSNVCRSYLARAECMAHLGDQKSAVLDFSAALEVNPNCVEALCGRGFMRLALGEEHECVEDMVAACDLDIYTVTAHINVLPDEAKKLLLFWLDHRVVALLLNYGYKATNNIRTSTGGSASTISVMDETALKPGHESTPNSSLSSLQIPSPNSTEHEREKGKTQESKVVPNGNESGNVRKESLNMNNNREDISPSSSNRNVTSTPVIVEVHTDPVQEEDTDKNEQARNGERTHEDVEAALTKRKFHKSSASTRNLKDALLSMDKAKVDENGVHENDKPFTEGSRRSTAMTTTSSLFTYEDVFTGMEKAEILHKAQLLGRLLINVDPSNATWHGMFADILIVKGDFDEALRHLQVVMELMPADVTAIARAGLINVKQNRYKLAARLLSVLAEVDKHGLLYVLRALDSSKRERLGEEALKQADDLIVDEKFDKAIEYCGLSLFAHEGKRIEKLRMRARCFSKIGENKRAIEDMSLVLCDTAKHVKAGDYCMRAHMYLQDNNEGEACLDYMKALKIDRDQAALQIHSKPGRNCVARVFYRQALEKFSHHEYQDCFEMCDYGLMVEDSIDLRKLRARSKREISKCIIQ